MISDENLAQIKALMIELLEAYGLKRTPSPAARRQRAYRERITKRNAPLTKRNALPSEEHNKSITPKLQNVTRGKPESKSKSTWESYGSAYQQRYGAQPVQNRTTRAQMAQFVDRIQASEAPAVAAFYVRSNRGFYVQNRHSVGMLLRDAEALRTEWATGVNGTDTEARQADRTQAIGNVFGPMIAEARERKANEAK